MLDLRTTLSAAALAVATMMTGGEAVAATMEFTDYSVDPNNPNSTPNDCAGLFGQPFDECIEPVYGSPVIAKYDLDNDVWTIAAQFAASVTSSMFSFVGGTPGSTGTWNYDPGLCADCPDVTSYVLKSGAGFRHYWTNPQTAITTGDWVTLANANGGGNGFSHITWYDTDGGGDTGFVIPVPAALPLLLTGLGILGIARSRRKA